MAHAPSIFCDDAFNWFFNNINRQILLHNLDNKKFSRLKREITCGGRRLSEQTIKLQQHRIRTELRKHPAEACSFAMLIVPTRGPWRILHQIMLALNEDTLRKHWRNAIRTSSNPGHIIAALLHFPPSTWQGKLAFRLLSCRQAWDVKPQPDKLPTFLTFIQQAIDASQNAFLGAQPQQPADNTSTPGEDLQKQLKAEYNRGRVEQEKKGADERKQLAAQLKEARRELEEKQKSLEQLNKQLQQEQADHAQQLARISDEARQHYENQLDLFLEQTFNFDAQIAAQAGNARFSTDDILHKLQQATEQQILHNRKAGTKHHLRQQRQQLTDAITTLRQVIDDSVATLPAANAILHQAEQQLAHVNDLLSQAGEETTAEHLATTLAFSQLEIYIRTIKIDEDAEATLKKTASFLHEAYEHELISDDELKLLSAKIQQRLNYIHNQKQAQKQKLHTLAAQPPVQQKREPLSILQLGNFLQHMHKVTIIFDGYNTMIRDQRWKAFEKKNSNNFDDGRHQFIATIARQASCFKWLELIFDGTGTTTTREHFNNIENLRVVYTAYKNGVHDADVCIIDRAHEIRATTPDATIWVVTNDFDLREQLNDVCDAFVDTSAIATFFP